MKVLKFIFNVILFGIAAYLAIWVWTGVSTQNWTAPGGMGNGAVGSSIKGVGRSIGCAFGGC